MKTGIKQLIIMAGIVSSLLSFQSIAAEQKPLKLGFVNSIKLMETAPQVEKANKRLEREFSPRQRKIVALQKEVRKIEENITKDRSIMSDDKLRSAERELLHKKRELKRQQSEFRDDYNIRRAEELDKLQKHIFKIIQEIAKKESYDLILPDSSVVWASKRVDITDTVLRRLRR